MRENDSVLKMKDLYFSKFSFMNNREQKSIHVQIKHNARYESIEEDDNARRVVIDTVVLNEESKNILSLQTVGIFAIQNDKKDAKLDDDTIEFILSRNTLAIMFPFIRSQIVLLTTQPGMSPILMQQINVNSMNFTKINKED